MASKSPPLSCKSNKFYTIFGILPLLLITVTIIVASIRLG